jgi:hypothetical protein
VLLFRWLETLTALGDVRLLLYGTGLLVVLYALPAGLYGAVVPLRDRVVAAAARRRGLPLAPAAPAGGEPGGPPAGAATGPRDGDDGVDAAVLAGALAGGDGGEER